MYGKRLFFSPHEKKALKLQQMYPEDAAAAKELLFLRQQQLRRQQQP